MNAFVQISWLAALLTTLLLSGCRGTAMTQQTYAYEEIKPGATLVLRKAIRFPAYTAAVNIQDGEIKSGLFALDQYHPNCRLELKSQAHEARTLQPGRFTIYKVSTYIEYVMRQPLKVAGWGINLASSISDEIYSTTLHLKSAQQSEVELMSCQHWEDPSNYPAHLSLGQIQKTLHGLMTIENN